MIDINTIISQALAAAVQQATAPLLERIAALEAQSADRHARLRVLEGALTDRVATLEGQSAALLNRVTAVNAVADRLHERVAALEPVSPQGIGVLLENLDNQEWFWHKIREFTGNVVEQAVEQHCEEYDHDDMLMSDALPDMDDYIKREDLDSEVRDAVRDIMEDAKVSIRI